MVKVLNIADRHPHVVEVLSAGKLAEGSRYIAMEDLGRLRDGESLCLAGEAREAESPSHWEPAMTSTGV